MTMGHSCEQRMKLLFDYFKYSRICNELFCQLLDILKFLYGIVSINS